MVSLRCRKIENAEAKNRIGDKDRNDGDGDFADGDSLPCADGGVRMSYRYELRMKTPHWKSIADAVRLHGELHAGYLRETLGRLAIESWKSLPLMEIVRL